MKRIKPEEDLIFVRAVQIIPEHSSVPYPYEFKTNDEVPATLRDILASVKYISDTKALFVPSNVSVTDDDDEDDEDDVVEVGETAINTM